MTKSPAVEVQCAIAKRQLFGARRRLEHFIKMYYDRQWRRYYQEDAFAKAVREARQAVPQFLLSLDGSVKQKFDTYRVFRSPYHGALTAQLSIMREQQNELIRKYVGCDDLEACTGAGYINHQACSQG